MKDKVFAWLYLIAILLGSWAVFSVLVLAYSKAFARLYVPEGIPSGFPVKAIVMSIATALPLAVALARSFYRVCLNPAPDR